MDFVVTWVNGSDPEWRAEMLKYKNETMGDNSPARFREWDNLKFWFRGVEKFAPWVDKIHFVTWGHVPYWLNIDHPKLEVVTHKDYIPSRYLPTFNSRTIELNLHRLENLSEDYVLFNDDMFIIDRVTPKQFFQNNLPCDMPIMKIYTGGNFQQTLFKNVQALNEKHPSNKRKAFLQNPFKWVNIKYGKSSMKNLILLLINRHRYTGFINYHLPQPSKKSTLQEIWEMAYCYVDETCRQPFRVYTTVNPYIQRIWNLASNNFTPFNINTLGENLELRVHDPEEVAQFIKNQKKPILCVNDHRLVTNFEESKKIINEAFESILPEKSTFEI